QLVYEGGPNAERIALLSQNLTAIKEPIRKDVMQALKRAMSLTQGGNGQALQNLTQYYRRLKEENEQLFNSHLHSESRFNAMKVAEVPAQISANSKSLNGYEILNHFFDKTFETNPAVFAFGEDVGKIGDVNQGFSGLQEKHGQDRIFDTGIRELTIMGQGMGMAMRGLRPIAEIQYL